MTDNDILHFNRKAWDQWVEDGIVWSIPVTSEQVAAARRGEWQIVLTPTVPVPRGWFPDDIHGADVLCLASGGGQQGPILAAAGANVTVFDNSPRQLARDREVAERDGLAIRTMQGDMADLSVFADESFDLVFNPVSTVFVPEVRLVWRETARVLRHGGALLVGFSQPHIYCLDQEEAQTGGRYYVRWSLPYADTTSITPEERAQRYGADSPLEFSHTFTEQLGGMMSAGLHLVDIYEDIDPGEPIARLMPSFMAIKAIKPK
jgi:ubiquinone/menaquinone biosynthesis C-methylase UbiE